MTSIESGQSCLKLLSIAARMDHAPKIILPKYRKGRDGRVRRPGGGHQPGGQVRVSILTRRDGRVRRSEVDRAMRALEKKFQSSPGVMAGCDDRDDDGK